MDAERLEALQIGRVKVRAGDVEGFVHSFRTSRTEGYVRLCDEKVCDPETQAWREVTWGPDMKLEVLGKLDEAQVAKVRAERAANDAKVAAARKAAAAVESILADPDALARLKKALA